jgi:hypothetical protein
MLKPANREITMRFRIPWLPFSIIGLWIIALLLSIHTAISNPVYQYQYQFTKPLHSSPSDSIQFIQADQRTIIQISHAFGIGSATISLKSGHWPRTIVLRFQYDQTRGFSMLENLEITTTRLQLYGNPIISEKLSFRLPDAAGIFPKGDVVAGEMNVWVEQRNRAMEVTLPAHLFTGSQTVKLAWIDAYRR